ncbi:MAG TPA: 6-pyruvoyl tetrahydropterin synthase, partial [Gammaproteobacteria bacterium]|nr:6-pyruvoyl tetrahydropterin synthase [Gammaproteobacteria bacterium]
REHRLHGHSFLARVWARFPPNDLLFPGIETDVLAERLQMAVTPLNYTLLNGHLPVPTDENLTHWIRARLGMVKVERVGVQSTCDQGTDWSQSGSVHLWRRFPFEAAHQLPYVPPGHPCGRMHGHGFAVILHARLPASYELLETQWAPLHEQLHLNCLNELPGLENPTSEQLAAWLWQRVKPQLPALSWGTVYETETA